MSAERVLIVDDENEFSQVMAERMKARGLSVDTAQSGKEGIEKVREHAFDAIVLDLVMPGMDGIETLKVLLEENSDLQVILLTGQATVSKGVEAIQQGAIDFLEKPVNLDELVKRISEAGVRKMLLVQKEMEKKMEDILKTKGW
jgi:DNA-binding NtrC family response regulator